jgi:tetratricopeptide (TPR) repeat protein
MIRRWQPVTGLRGGLIALGLLVGWTAGGLAQSRDYNHIGYWRDQYQELTPTTDPRVDQARRIFQRLVQVAGTRAGKVPQLFIAATTRDPWDITLPIALPDGWIILSKRVLDICYRDQAQGEDRLAFVLAHELAHQLSDDLLHLHFFQALVALQGQPRDADARAALETALQTASDRNVVRDKELRADMNGIMYAAMAGFNPRAIVTEGPNTNFFADWVRELEQQSLRSVSVNRLSPTPQERAEAVRARLRPVADNTPVFQVGLWFYYAGDYPRALQAFARFREVFPSREVLHNLATSHHQLALQAYQAWQQDALLPFQLSVTIDPLTRASRSYLTGPTRGGAATPGTPPALFRQHLDEAITLYQEALAHDAAYTPAAINLGDALIMRGLQTRTDGLNPDWYGAVTMLTQALGRAPDTPALLNTLGVASFYVGQLEYATRYLDRARTLAPTYAAPVWNLRYLAQHAHRDADAQRYWSDYQRLAPSPSQGTLAPNQQPESALGLTIGSIEADIPPQWGSPVKNSVRVGKESYTVAAYPAGKLLLVQDGEIRMILIREGYAGRSARGLGMGSAAHEVLTRYGPPTRQAELTQGHSWSYDPQRIAFQVRDGKVISWLLF